MEKRTSSSVRLKNKAASFYFFTFFFIFIFFFSFCALISFITSTATCIDMRCSFPAQSDFYLQDYERRKVRESGAVSIYNKRRILSGPGSSPPRCTSKCGNCTPCKPVHVPVPPGTPVTTEYYPEAWRCKCGNKLYMP